MEKSLKASQELLKITVESYPSVFPNLQFFGDLVVNNLVHYLLTKGVQKMM